MDITEAQRKTVGRLVREERRRRYGDKKAAYTAAGVNPATWDRIEAGLRVREDRLSAALRALLPQSEGDWRALFGQVDRASLARDAAAGMNMQALNTRLDQLEARVVALETGGTHDHTAPTSQARESRAQDEYRIAAHPMKGGESQGRRLRDSLDGVGEESQDIERDEQGE